MKKFVTTLVALALVFCVTVSVIGCGGGGTKKGGTKAPAKKS